MTHYAIYFKAQNTGFIGEDYPIIISSDKSLLKQNFPKKLHDEYEIRKIVSLPDKICAQEKWCKINETTFFRNSENKHNLEEISSENLSKILSNS
jgi:hypothetical protein